jgi:hypothetical protein
MILKVGWSPLREDTEEHYLIYHTKPYWAMGGKELCYDDIGKISIHHKTIDPYGSVDTTPSSEGFLPKWISFEIIKAV